MRSKYQLISNQEGRLALTAALLGLAFALLGLGGHVHALAPSNYTNYLIDNATMRNSSTMGATDIQNFLAAEGSGLTSFQDIENCGSPSGPHYSYYVRYYSCGNSRLASQIIYDVSQAYGINPRVILATLEKEQSLVTDPSPSGSQLNCAMGYSSCSNDQGFFNQVDNGTWQFRTDMELGAGNSWWGFSPSSYPCETATSLYSNGLLPGNNVTFRDDNGTTYANITIPNMATATLYCYTPYVYNNPQALYGNPRYGYAGLYYSGSYNFVNYFSLWWGTTYSQDTLTNNPGSVSWGYGRIDVFARAEDGALWQKYYDINAGGWSGWAPLNLSLNSAPTVSSWGHGRLDVFYVGTDGSLDHYWYDNSIGGWQNVESLGQPSPGVSIVGSPTAVSWGSGRIDIFVRGSDNALWQETYDGSNGGWQPWISRGGDLNSSPSVSSWASGRLDVFASGPVGDLEHFWYDGTWHSAESLGVPGGGVILSTAPGATSWGYGRIDVFGRGSDGVLWQKWFDTTGWHPWFRFTGVLSSAPSMSTWAPGRLDEFSTGPAGDLQHYWFNNNWGNWESLGEPVG